MSAVRSLPPLPMVDAQLQAKATRTAIALAASKAETHLREAERLASLSNGFALRADEERKEADRWLDIALAGARKLAGAPT